MWAESMSRASSTPADVVGHVRQQVGRIRSPAEDQLADHGSAVGWIGVDPRRQPNITVVESDHAEPELHQLVHERLTPGDHLGSQAHHQQEWLALAPLVVREVRPLAVI